MQKSFLFFLVLITLISFSCQSSKETEGKQEIEATEAAVADSINRTVETANKNSLKFSSWLEGKIDNKYTIWMFLDVDNGKANGSYRYIPKTASLKVSGTIDDSNKLILTETNDKGEVTGYFEGIIHYTGYGDGRFFEGKWMDAKKTKTLPLTLDPVGLALIADTTFENSGKPFSVKRYRKVNHSYAYDKDAMATDLSETDAINKINKEGFLNSDFRYYSDIYFEELNNDFNYAGKENISKELAKGIEEQFKFEFEKGVKKNLDNITGYYEKCNIITLVGNSFITTSSNESQWMMGAAYPTYFSLTESFDKESGTALGFSDIFESSKLKDLNVLMKNKIDKDCIDAEDEDCISYNPKDPQNHVFGITSKGVEVYLSGCSYPHAMMQCAFLYLTKSDIRDLVKKGGPVQ